MNTLDVAIHALALPFDVACILAVRRRPELASGITFACGAGALIVPTLTALQLTELDMFAGMRALTWVLFVHAPIVLLATAWLAREVRRPDAIAHTVAAALLVLAGIDAFVIEPRWLEVTRVEVPTTELREPLRIAVLSDIQSDDFGAWEEAAFRAAMAEKPDLIVLPGDFVQIDEADGPYDEQVRRFRELLPILQAPLGVWAVQGNVDWRDTWASDLFAGTHVRASTRTHTERVGPLSLTSVDFVGGWRRDLVLPAEDGFHVAFAHIPNFALSDRVGADLLIAGHTHGGQVAIPLLGPPLTLAAIPRAWAAGGLSDIGRGRHLVVVRGVGMERHNAPRFRFNCRPQVGIVDVVPR